MKAFKCCFRVGFGLMWILLGASLGAQQEEIFASGFELPVGTQVTHGIIELRSPDGTVRLRLSTDAKGEFPKISTALVQPGDRLVVYGGFWRNRPFAGEMTLLMAESDSFQIVNPVTTLVTRLAESSQVTGSTARQRIDAAISKLSALYMVGEDWFQPDPDWIGGGLEFDIDASGGLLNWADQLLSQIEAGALEEQHMDAFPYANAGIRGLASVSESFEWRRGARGDFSLLPDLTVESPAGLDYRLISAPDWIFDIGLGRLAYRIPGGETAGEGEISLEFTHRTLDRSRTITIPFQVLDATVVAEDVFDDLGGEIWHPNNSIGYRIRQDSVDQLVTVRLIETTDSRNDETITLETDPLDYQFIFPPEPLFAGGQRAVKSATRSATCDTELDDGWVARQCARARYLALLDRLSGVGLTLNRVEALPPDLLDVQAQESANREAWVLASLCSDCATRSVPVLFVHGFTAFGGIGGGDGTWGDMPRMLDEFGAGEFAVYEFRYRTNARFQDIAWDLSDAINAIHAETGKKVHIVAHSFGGLVARTYLQILSGFLEPPDSPFQDCQTSVHPKVASLLTLGTPHSGIAELEGPKWGLVMPKGQQGLGNLIAFCTQLSCWQAGSGAAFAGSARLEEAYRLEQFPGAIIADLADFGRYPLRAPTKALIGLDYQESWNDRQYSGGDGLISFQGQRFSPQLVCDESACSNLRVTSAPRTEIGGQNIGHCVWEDVLGADPARPRPLPGEDGLADDDFYRYYLHAGFSLRNVPLEAKVDRVDHMPYLYATANGLEGGWASDHDTFNQVLSWLLMLRPGDPIDPDGPPSGQLAINIFGQGEVGFFGPDGVNVCGSSCSFTVDQGVIELQIASAAGAQLETVSDNCLFDLTTQSCTVSVARSTTVNLVFTGGDQAQIVVGRQGSGTISVEPGGELCLSRNCQLSFDPGTEATLRANPVGGATFAGWSGDCSGGQPTCQLLLADAGSRYVASAEFRDAVPPGETFTDCAACPTMVTIPAGSFVQGSPSDELERDSDEGPQRTVNVPAFAMGQTEVTFAEWDACVADGGCTHNPSDFGWGRGARPVVAVSWNDAQEYITWLSNRTGRDYRLPSESEWEYATRAGTTGRFNTGECVTADQANFNGNYPAQGCPSSLYREQTLPVGSFAPNAFGLYDTHGNVGEWVQDCWNSTYEGAPTDGSAWASGDCSRAVIRGYAWFGQGRDQRSAERDYWSRDFRNYGRGLRVARSTTH